MLCPRRRRCVLVALAATALLVGPAHAQWSSSATGPATAKSTTLEPPSNLTATCGGGIGGLLATEVRLAWSASATASLGPVQYEVGWGTSSGSTTWRATTAELSYDTGALSGSLFGTTYYFVVRTAAGTVWRSSNSNQRSRTISTLGCS